MLIRHVAAVCRVEVTKHGEQDRFAEGRQARAWERWTAKLRAVIRKGEPVSASKHKDAGGQPSEDGEANTDGEVISKCTYLACRGDSGQRVVKE